MCSARVSEFFKFPTLSFSPSPPLAMPEHLGCRGFLLLGNDVLNDGLRHGTMWCWVDRMGIGTWWKVGGNHISWDLFFRWCFTFLPVLNQHVSPPFRRICSTSLQASNKQIHASHLREALYWWRIHKRFWTIRVAIKSILTCWREMQCITTCQKKNMAFFGAVGSEFPFASMDFREKGSSIWWDCLFFSNFRLMKYVSARQMLFLSFIFHMMNDTCSGYDSRKIGPSKWSFLILSMVRNLCRLFFGPLYIT